MGANVKIETINFSKISDFIKSEEFKNGIELFSIKKYKKDKDSLIIFINMVDEFRIMKKYIKRLIKYSKFLNKNFEYLKIFLLYYDDKKILHKQFKELINPIFSENKEYVYSKAYDLACDYLDSFFYGKNLCDFCNNKCGYKRDFDLEVGCCRHFGLFFGEKLVRCENLGDDGKCTIQCLCCKLMTCKYLNKKGIRFKQKEIFPLYSTFNLLQRIYVKCIAYTSKEKIMKGILFLSH